MRFIISIGGQDVIVGAEQFDVLVNTLSDVQFLDQQYVSSSEGGGEDGTNYIKVVRPFAPHDKLSVRPMHEDYYQSRVLVTKMFDEKKKK